MLRQRLAAAGVAVLACACVVRTGTTGVMSTGGPSSGSSAGEPPVVQPSPAAPAGRSEGYSPTQYVEPDEWFVGNREFQTGYVSTALAKQTAAPAATGEAAFLKLSDGSSVTSKYFWKTRPARPEELQVGMLAMAVDKRENGLYRPPRSRDEARNSQWFLSRIVSIDPLGTGFVHVSGGYKVMASGIRLIEGDSSPRAAVGGAEDGHYLHPDHYLVGERDLPQSGYLSVHVAVLIKPPSAETRGEGQYLITSNGKIVWSKYAWLTRRGSNGDIQIGTYSVALDRRENGAYRAPQSREQALHSPWFIAKIVDTKELYKGTFEVAGGYKIDPAALRVLVK